MKILSAHQIKEVDKATIIAEPISSIELMERAATACADWIIQHYNTTKHFAVFCGSGNNGGDGLAIARILKQKHYIVTVYIVSNVAYSDNVESNFELWQNSNGKTISIKSDDDFPNLSQTNLVVIDCLFGSGLNRQVKGLPAQLIEHINKSEKEVIAIDIPSGMFVDNNATNLNATIITATHTLSLELPKLALLLPENKDKSGEMHIIPIGLNQEAIEKQESPYEWITFNYFKNFLKKRKRFSHKGTYGHVKIVAGSKGKIGAAVLATKASLRTGAGLATAEIPNCGYSTLQTAVPEAMVSVNGKKHISERIDLNNHFIGIGPGIGTKEETKTEILRLISRTNEPLVIDADALNILAENKDYWDRIPMYSILTPHPKEWTRWIGNWNNDFEKLERTIKFAKEYCLYVVIKGSYTVTITPKGNLFFNSSGNPGMATAGSGDVLTGILIALLAQGYTSGKASVLGVYLHGLAGDLAKKEKGEYSLIASDIIENIGNAYKTLLNQ